MRIEGEHLLQGPRDEVYIKLGDRQVLAAALPGVQSLTQIDEQFFEGNFTIRSGPLSGQFAGKVEIVGQVPSQSITYNIDLKGAPGKARGVVCVQLYEESQFETRAKYSVELDLSGSLAQTNARVLEGQVRAMAKEGCATLERALRIVEVAAEEENQRGGEMSPENTDEGVDNRTARWMKIPEVRMLVYIIPVGAVILALSFVLTQCMP